MGLSASQARYLQLTARKNDKEYQAQQINQRRNEIAKRLSDASLQYSEGINNRRLMFAVPKGDASDVKKVTLDYKTITAAYPEGLGYTLVTSEGVEVRPSYQETVEKSEKLKTDADNLYNITINNKYFAKVDENNDKIKIDGQNFAKEVGFADPILDATGNIVDSKKFLASISEMNAAEFNYFWNSNGYHRASGEEIAQSFKIINTEDADEIKKIAENRRDALYYEAEEMLKTPVLYDDRCNNNDYLEKQLRSGEWTLRRKTDDEIGYEDVNYSNLGNIVDELDTSDDAAVTAEYEHLTSIWQQKDKELELQLQQIQSEHNAIETEIDSVKKVIQKNVEKSFKTFG